MKKTINRLFICLLAAVLLCSQLTVGAFAAAPSNRIAAGQAAAEELYALGLIQGSGTLPDGSPNFALDRTSTRGEALVLLVRLLGEDENAMTGHYRHPFTDAGWADAYVGYAYATQLVNGISATKFGTSMSITLNQFLTLVLHALGYNDVDWRSPYSAADAIGLSYPAGEGFYRADMLLICLNSLDCRLNGQNITLRTKLTDAGVIDPESGSEPSGVFVTGPVKPLVTEITVSSTDEFITQIAVAALGHAEKITVHVPNGQVASYIQALGTALNSLSNPFSEANGYSASYTSSTIWITPKYSDAVRVMAWLEGRSSGLSEQDAKMLSAARNIHDTLVTPNMSEYDQVKAFHDYIVNNTEYRETGERSHSAIGSLVDGLAVCEGYAKAFDLLCYLSGIECLCINGTGNGGGHGWNKVKIDGEWYNVDVTWDDPVSSRPILRYDYFLVSDNVLARDHDWIAYSFWPEALSNYGR